MKAMIKRAWGALAVLWRPIAGKVESFQARTLRDPLAERVDSATGRVGDAVEVLGQEVNLALNSCIREIARLEMQLDALREAVEELSAGPRSRRETAAHGPHFSGRARGRGIEHAAATPGDPCEEIEWRD